MARFRDCLASKVHTGAPEEPLFVKTWITPADASVPYSVVAAAPLMISIRSMSFGLMLFSGRMLTLPPSPELR